MTLLAFLAGCVHFASFDFRRQPIDTDVGFYLYFAGLTADGEVPYRDFFEHKTPLAIFAGAALQNVGKSLGIVPLHAVRIGYLLFMAATCAALFSLAYILVGGRPAGAWIVLLTLFGLPFLGLMPATGNIPKLLAMMFAFAAIAAMRSGKWELAGASVMLSALDWQVIGALSLLSLLGTLLLFEKNRGRAFARSCLGLFLVLTPFLAYFAYHHALSDCFRATVLSSFAKGTSPLLEIGFGDRWNNRIVRNLLRDTSGSEWILLCSIPGLLIFLASLPRLLKSDRRVPAFGMAVHQFGLIGFSLFDFQAHGDVFPLLVTLGLFGAIPPVLLYYGIVRAVRHLFARGANRFRGSHLSTGTGVLFFLVLVFAVKPSFMAGGLRLNEPAIRRGSHELHDQEEVADRFFEGAGDRTVTFLYKWELLYLANRHNPLPFIYWNAATHRYYNPESHEEAFEALVSRLNRLSPEIVVPSPGDLRRIEGKPLKKWLDENYTREVIRAENRSYTVEYWQRN